MAGKKYVAGRYVELEKEVVRDRKRRRIRQPTGTV